MKGHFFAKPLEYKIDIIGESWQQGDTIEGALIVSNQSSEDINVNNLGCHLCLGNNKKIKTKDKEAFTLVDSVLLTDKLISAKSSTNINFKFSLTSIAPISENSKALYIICGDIKEPFSVGILELNIKPIKVISDFIDLFQSFYKFKFKTLKNKKDAITAIITPPDSKDWVNIQKMNMLMKVQEDKLYLDFQFSLKKLSFDKAETGTKDSKLDIPIALEKKDYLGFGDILDQQKIMKVLDKVLDQVRLKKLI